MCLSSYLCYEFAWLSFRPLQMMCLACKYFKLSVSCVFTHQVLSLIHMLVNTLYPSSLFVYYVCLCFIENV